MRPFSLSTLAGAAIALTLCVALAACGDGNSINATPTRGSDAAVGAGGSSEPQPIVAVPASAPCAASGAPASQPVSNTQLRCAP
ncbi:hypothetical protein [Paraburkholderia acidicola]|nr:hypothetical protein [Paraburkholderia acidicola]